MNLAEMVLEVPGLVRSRTVTHTLKFPQKRPSHESLCAQAYNLSARKALSLEGSVSWCVELYLDIQNDWVTVDAGGVGQSGRE
jgi:hypothetical protein